MSNRIVLLSDRQSCAELEQCAAMPAGALGRHTADGPDRGAGAPFLFADASFLTDDSYNEEQRRARMGELLNASFVHLVVVRNPPGGAGEAGGLKSADHLAALQEWYRKFAALAEEKLKNRRHEYSKILVLVFVDHPPKGSSQRLQAMLEIKSKADGAEHPAALLNRCYVMLPELECGEQSALAARYLWPYYVAHLLVRLQAMDFDRNAAPEIFTWRSYEIRQPIARDALETSVQRGLDLFSKHLSSHKTMSSLKMLDGARTLDATKLEIANSRSDDMACWFEYVAATAANRKTDTAMWRGTFGAAREKCSADFSAALAHALPGDAGSAALWTDVHQDPARIGRLSAELSLAAAKSRDRVAPAETSLNDYLQEWATWERNCVRLIECAAEFDKARHGFLQRLYRIGLAGAVVMAVAFIGELVFWDIISHSFPGIAVIAGSTLAGAVAGALLPWRVERRHGEDALDFLQTQLKKLDDDAQILNAIGQAMVSAAVQSHDLLALHAAQARARMLIVRASSLIGQHTGSAASNPRPQSAGLTDAEQEDAFKQRSVFLKDTVLFLGVTAGAPGVDADFLGAVVDRQWAEFLKRWKHFCLADHACAGNLPAAKLLALLEDTRRRLTAALRVEIYDHWRASFRKEHDFTQWDSVLSGLNLHRFLYYLSCMAAEEELHMKNALEVLLIRRELNTGLSDHLQGGHRINLSPSELMNALPCEAIWHQEIPIKLGEDAQGRLVVDKQTREATR